MCFMHTLTKTKAGENTGDFDLKILFQLSSNKNIENIVDGL